MQRQDVQSPPLSLDDSSDTQQHSPYYPIDSSFHSQATPSSSLWKPTVQFQPWTAASAPLTTAIPEGEAWDTVKKYYEQTSGLPPPPQPLPKAEVEAELRSLTTATRMALQVLHEDEIQRPAPDWSRLVSGSPLPPSESSEGTGPPEASPLSSKDSQVISPPASFALEVGSKEPTQGRPPTPSTSSSEFNLLQGWDIATIDLEQTPPLQGARDGSDQGAGGQDDSDTQDQPRRKGRARMSQEKRRRLARRKEREAMMEQSLKGPSPSSMARNGGPEPPSATTSSQADGSHRTGPTVEIPRRRSETSTCLSSSTGGRRCAQDMPCVSCSVDEATRTRGPGRTLSTIANTTSMGTDRYRGPVSSNGSHFQGQDYINFTNSPPSSDLNASFLQYLESLSISSKQQGSYPHPSSSSDSFSSNASRSNSTAQQVQRGHCCLRAARQLPCQHVDGFVVADRPSPAFVATGLTRPDVWRSATQHDVDGRSSERSRQEKAPLRHSRMQTHDSNYPVSATAHRLYGSLDHLESSSVGIDTASSSCPTAYPLIGDPRQHHSGSQSSMTGFENRLMQEASFERRRDGPELWSSDGASYTWRIPPSRGSDSLQDHVATFLDRLQRYQQQQQHSQHQRSLSHSNIPEDPHHPQYHLNRHRPQQMPRSYPPPSVFSPSALNQQPRGPSLTHHQRAPSSYRGQSRSPVQGFHPGQRRRAESQRQGDDYPPWRQAATINNNGVQRRKTSPSTSTMSRREEAVPVDGNGRDRRRSPW